MTGLENLTLEEIKRILAENSGVLDKYGLDKKRVLICLSVVNSKRTKEYYQSGYRFLQSLHDRKLILKKLASCEEVINDYFLVPKLSWPAVKYYTHKEFKIFQNAAQNLKLCQQIFDRKVASAPTQFHTDDKTRRSLAQKAKYGDTTQLFNIAMLLGIYLQQGLEHSNNQCYTIVSEILNLFFPTTVTKHYINKLFVRHNLFAKGKKLVLAHYANANVKHKKMCKKTKIPPPFNAWVTLVHNVRDNKKKK